MVNVKASLQGTPTHLQGEVVIDEQRFPSVLDAVQRAHQLYELVNVSRSAALQARVKLGRFLLGLEHAVERWQPCPRTYVLAACEKVGINRHTARKAIKLAEANTTGAVSIRQAEIAAGLRRNTPTDTKHSAPMGARDSHSVRMSIPAIPVAGTLPSTGQSGITSHQHQPPTTLRSSGPLLVSMVPLVRSQDRSGQMTFDGLYAQAQAALLTVRDAIARLPAGQSQQLMQQLRALLKDAL